MHLAAAARDVELVDRGRTRADALSDTVKERPLIAVGIAALGGYLIGRLMGGNTYVYPRDRR